MRRSNPAAALYDNGLLRYARNDVQSGIAYFWASPCPEAEVVLPVSEDSEAVRGNQGPTGISLPTNTGAPEGAPVGEPPCGSSVTA